MKTPEQYVKEALEKNNNAFNHETFVDAFREALSPKWIPVEERLPEKVNRILCLEKIYSDQYRYFVGFYTKGHEVEYDPDQEPEFDEYEEKNGCYYLKPGFYECEEQINDDDFFFKRPVTHWMPLPEHP